MERFSIPGAGGIIIKEMNGENHILLQERFKEDVPMEHGWLEIPSGKNREYESIFETLIREVKEETGLDVTEIIGADKSSIYSEHGYKVINFLPFACAQNIGNGMPHMVNVFICHVKGNLLKNSDESINYQWVTIKELAEKLICDPDKFFPMHVDTLKKFVALYK